MRLIIASCLLTLVAGACSDDDNAIRLNVDDINVTTPEDTPLNVRIDIDSNRSVSAQIVTQPTHGTVTTQGTGEGTNYMYTPEADYAGADAITVELTAGDKSAMATINITVTPVNDVPVANPDSFAADFETPVTIAASALLMNDTDKDSTTLSVMSVAAGPHGSVAMEGTQIVFTPDTGYQGAASFKYTLSDGSATALGDVEIAVGNNTPPVAGNDTGTTPEDTAVTFQSSALLANDTDAEHQTLSITSVGSATHGTVGIAGGVITFTPAANYFGAASFEYTVVDGAGAATASVAVTVTPVNDLPIANNDSASVAEDSVLTLGTSTLIANDSDVDGDTLTITGVTSGANGTATMNGADVTFTPSPDFFGSTSFTYTLSDGTATTTGTVNVVVVGTNDAPVAIDDALTGPEDMIVEVPATTLLSNDVDVDGDTLSLVSVSGATNGSVAFSNGLVRFTPTPNFFGAASFNYMMSDGTSQDSGTVSITITPVNDAPSIGPDSATTPEDVAVDINVLANDTDIDSPVLMVSGVSAPAHGTVSVTAGGVTYTPEANYNGPDSFTYIAGDGAGGMTTGTVSVTVTPVNDPPVAVNDAFTINEDVTSTFAVRMNDTDVDNDPLTLLSVSTPPEGTTTIVNGSVRFVPNPNFFGAVTFTYTLTDSHSDPVTGTVVVTVLPLPDPAVAVDDEYQTPTMEPFTVSAANGVMANDQFIDGPETVEIVESPNWGIVSLNPDGSFTYTVQSDCVDFDYFTYRVIDGTNPPSEATVYININHPPDVGNLYYYTFGDDPFVVPDPQFFWLGVVEYQNDFNDDDLTALLVTPPAHASTFLFNADGSFTYIPVPGFRGTDTFEFSISDGLAPAVVAMATIDVYEPCVPSDGGGCTSPADEAVMSFAHYNTLDFDDVMLGGSKCCYDFLARAASLPPGTIAGGCCGKCDIDGPAPNVQELDIENWW